VSEREPDNYPLWRLTIYPTFTPVKLVGVDSTKCNLNLTKCNAILLAELLREDCR
jgi:hypothetical protein